MTGIETITLPDSMVASDVMALFDALQAGGASVRFVGGCVRDAILQRPIADIDVATDAEPGRVREMLKGCHIKSVPTGVAHGTLTVVPQTRAFHVTTLRRDIKTDGRHATVAYTTDWAEDARRRDFTINAMYLGRDGTLHDYVGGLADLHEGRVRFIGKPSDRIAEDYLRILRFFRFHATYGKLEPDPEGVAACQKMARKAKNLSGERIWRELSRTLRAPEPGPVFNVMEDIGLLGLIFATKASVPRLTSLSAVEKFVAYTPDPIRRLSALTLGNEAAVSEIVTRLRLSRGETARMRSLSANQGQASAGMKQGPLSCLMYDLGTEIVCDLILLQWADQITADGTKQIDVEDNWKTIWDIASAWTRPRFPLNGADLLRAGIEEGPQIGKILSTIEKWWISASFHPDREACLKKLCEFLQHRHP